ncbi:peroxidase 7 [Durio zibethinus]|uniref:peroxidase n=1 Tax=Durio zibethinus TaxID=66656 RepID=A0A6P6ACH5_DURZI|nr:peroxidase 7 [Durio zibethinus]
MRSQVEYQRRGWFGELACRRWGIVVVRKRHTKDGINEVQGEDEGDGEGSISLELGDESFDSEIILLRVKRANEQRLEGAKTSPIIMPKINMAAISNNPSNSFLESVLDRFHGFPASGSGEQDSSPKFSTLPETSPFDNLLSFTYYHQRCPMLEEIISRKVKEWIAKDHSLAASLLRLHFHDCAVTGCDASILLNYEGSERTAEASKTLRGFQVIDDIKAEVEKLCPATVSCADILTAATRDATVSLGGPYWMVPYGRKDSRISNAKDADMVPSGRETITTLLQFFQSRGLNVIDLVVLSGAHTIGRTSCGAIQHRVYGLNGTGMPNPPIDDHYLDFLQRKCKCVSDQYVDLDATTPSTFDSQFYANLQNKMGLLSTDQILYSDSRTRPIVNTLIQSPSIFRHQFSVSMLKLGNIQVPTGQNEGEIRTNCNFVNSN